MPVAVLAAVGCGSQDGLTPTSPDYASAPTTPAISVSPNDNPVIFPTMSPPFDPNVDGYTAPTVTFTVTNTGTKSTSGLGFSITGTGAAAYSIRKGDNGCTGSLGTSPNNNSCTVRVTFAPTVAGTYTAALNVSVAKGKGLVSINLSGLAAAKISIIYNVTSGPDVAASFTTTGALSPTSFQLTSGESQVYTGLSAGSYSVTFTLPAGYEFDPFSTPSRWSCGYSLGTSVSLDTNTLTADITLGADGLVYCYYMIRQIP